MRRFAPLVIVASLLGCEEQILLEEKKRTPLEEIVEGLASDDVDAREVAAGRLADQRRTPLDLRQRLAALTLAAKPYPKRIEPNADSSADLIAAAASGASDEMIPVVRRLFPHYSRAGRVAAMNMLARMTSRSAAIGWMGLVRDHLNDEVIPSLPFGTLNGEPRHADVFMPEIVRYIDHERFGWDFTLLALRICQQDLVAKETMREVAPLVLNRYYSYEERLRTQQKEALTSYRFRNADYSRDRAWASLLLDLIACLPRDVARKPLQGAFTFRDPRLKYFAVSSYAKQYGTAPRRRVAEAAANAEVRAWLFESLDDMRLTRLMPARYRNQEAIAESELVRWLINENELGEAPAAVVLEDVISIDTETSHGVVDYYVFRFRADSPGWAAERGWMAGVAGGYPRHAQPTTSHDDHVFSRFEAIDDRAPADHVGDLSQLHDAWQERAE